MNSTIMAVAVLLAGGILAEAQTTGPLSTGEFHWGEIVGGLQLGVALDDSNGIVHCRIRNATSNELSFSTFDPGYVEFIHFDMQDGTNWDRLAFVMPGVHPAAGFLPYQLKSLKPGEVIDKMSSFQPMAAHSYQEYMQWRHEGANEARRDEALNRRQAGREKLIWSLSRGDTFTLDLVEQQWPTNLPAGSSIQVRVRHDFRESNDGKMSSLYSPAFPISAESIRIFDKCRTALFRVE